MHYHSEALINLEVFERTRSQLGPHFWRIFGYLSDDGKQSVARIEAAVRWSDAAALVHPAHTLKNAALQFGVMRLARRAEYIEYLARDYVEMRLPPRELVEYVSGLSDDFEASLVAITAAASPLMVKPSRAA